jgi:enamine deaminase RidA (YjgF/YER057c/UK114 family)
MGNGGETDTLAKLMGGEGTALRYPQGDLRRISREEQLAYVAPFPTDEYKAGARAFPELVPTPDSDPTGRPQPMGGEENLRAWTDVFDSFRKPVITAFGDEDNVMRGAEAIWHDRCPGCAGQAHVAIEGAGHFLQDGGSEQLTAVIIGFIAANPPVHKEYIEPLPDVGFSSAVKYTVPGTGVTHITVSGAVGESANLTKGAATALSSLKATLIEAGATFADIVKINVYVVDIDDEKVAAVGRAMHRAFRHLPPDQRAASTWVGVTGLVSSSLGVEIECTAVIAESGAAKL